MDRSIESILRTVARKLLATRAAESAAATAILSAGAALPLMAAWILAGPWPRRASALALLPLLLVVLVLPDRLRRLGRLERRLSGWGLSPAIRWAAFLASGAASLTALVMIRTLAFVHVPHWTIPPALAGAAALAAAVAVCVRGVSLREAALYIDTRANLGERLTTALELSQAQQSSLFTDAVRRQALAVVGRYRPQRLGFWRRGRATAGMLGLTLLACAALMFIDPRPVPGLSERRRWEQLRQELAEELSRQAEEMRRQAQQGDDPSKQLERQAQMLAKLGERVKFGQLSPKEAMSELNRAQSQARADLARQDALDDAAERLKHYDLTRKFADAARDRSASAAAAANELAEQMARAPGQGGPSASQRQAVSEALRRAAQDAAADPRLSSALKAAAEAADRQAAEEFRSAMAQAAAAVEQTKSESDARNEIEQAIGNIEQQKQQLARGMSGITREDLEALASAAQKQDREGQADRQDADNGTGQGGGQGGGGQNGGQNGGQGGGQNGGQGGGQTGGQNGGGQNGGGAGQGAQAGPGGSGSTNLDAPSGPGGQAETGQFAEGRWKQVYDPRFFKTEGPREHVPGRADPNGEPVERMEFHAPAGFGESYVDRDRAWSAARSRAEDAMSRQRIPARYRKLIQDYYGAGQ